MNGAQFGHERVESSQFGGKIGRSLHYGPYYIVMDGSETDPVDISLPADLQGATVTDLGDESAVRLPETLTTDPVSSRVFYRDDVS